MVISRAVPFVVSCAFVCGLASAAWVEGGKLIADAPADSAGLGRSVAVSSDGMTIVVGASVEGAAYIYSKATGVWEQLQRVTITGGDLAEFGTSVAIGGDYVFVGAPKLDAANIDVGGVYVYELDTATGQYDEITPSPAMTPDLSSDNALFGMSVACSTDGAIVAVGSPGGGLLGRGLTEIHQLNGAQFDYSQSLDGEAGLDLAGYAVALDSDAETLVVGAIYHDGAGANRGKAYVYTRGVSGFIGTPEDVVPGDPANDDHFGASVAISPDGTQIIVGSPDADTTQGADMGAAYVFSFDGADWIQDQKIIHHLPVASAGLGTSVAASTTRLIVGAPKRLVFTGTVLIFGMGATEWELEEEILASDPIVGDALGTSVATTPGGATVVAGAAAADHGLASTYTDAGAAYVFVLPATASSSDDDGGCVAGGGGGPAAWFVLCALAVAGLARMRSTAA